MKSAAPTIILLLFLLLLWPYFSFTQNSADEVKITKYISKAEQIEYSNPDSSIYFYKLAIRICDSLHNISPNNSELIFQTAYAHQQLGWCYGYYKSNFQAADKYSRKAIEIYQSLETNNKTEIRIKAKKGIATCYSDMGVSLLYTGNNSGALVNFHKSLKLYEALESSSDIYGKTEGKRGLSKCFTNIGLVYINLFKYELALEYLLKSEKIDIELADSIGLRSNCINIGNIYSKLKQYDKSNQYYYKALKNAISENNYKQMSMCYTNIGSNLKQKKDYKNAIVLYKKSIELDKTHGDILGIAINYNNLSSLYINLKDYAGAITYAKAALKAAEEVNALTTKNYSFAYLSDTYDSIGDYKNALFFHKQFKETNDSIFNETSSRLIKEMEAKYQSEKKQLEIDNLTKNKALKDIELQRQQNEVEKQSITIYSFLLGFVIIVIFSIVLYRQFKAKKKANILLAKQNVEIQMKNEEIEAQRDEIEAQRDLVLIQKNEIEEIYEELTSSIRYAERIQHAVLPDDDLAKMFLANHFIFYKPRDIVSGDFYWTIIKKNWLLVAVADCTGHGVPGAFMSMLGISYLNEIFAKSDFTSTSHVLGKLREYIIKSLRQKGMDYEKISPATNENTVKVKDGMDITLIAINLETYKMQFSGANNPLYIIKTPVSLSDPDNNRDEDKGVGHTSTESTLSNANVLSVTDSIIELKGDKMPIAIHVKMDEFSQQDYQLVRGDTIYMFTDGFADQFGGKDKRKYMYKRFKELLIAFNNNTMNEQKEMLENELKEWIGEGEQIDDITVIGIRIE